MGKIIIDGIEYGGSVDQVAYTSSDIADSQVTTATGWTTVDPLVSGETNISVFTKLSQMFKNIRWLNKKADEFDTGHINDASITASSEKISITPETGSAYYPCFYIKVGCVVYVYLALSGLTANTASSITTLPVGYRPANSIVNIGRGKDIGKFARFSITDGGAISVRSEDDRAFTAFSFVV